MIKILSEKHVQVVAKTWLIGSLFKAGRKTYAQALYEFSYLIAWSILPFILAALTLYVISGDEPRDYIALTLSTFRNGELLVFTISMLAPILYMTLHDPDQADPFPHKLPISTIVALIIVICAALFALLKSRAVKDFDFVFTVSIILTIFALALRYLAFVYHRLRMPTVNEASLRSPQTEFVDDYAQHIGSVGMVPENKSSFAVDYEEHLKGIK